MRMQPPKKPPPVQAQRQPSLATQTGYIIQPDVGQNQEQHEQQQLQQQQHQSGVYPAFAPSSQIQQIIGVILVLF